MRYEEEPQRFLGIPIGRPREHPHEADRGARRSSIRGGRYDTRPRVLGIPTTGWGQKPIHLPWLRHPIRWTRWRLEVRRLGPYARKYEDIS
jgi:hypothetical protein